METIPDSFLPLTDYTPPGRAPHIEHPMNFYLPELPTSTIQPSKVPQVVCDIMSDTVRIDASEFQTAFKTKEGCFPVV